MNRREALAALAALPGVTSVRVDTIKPDDVIVVESEWPISQEIANKIKAHVEGVFPGRKVLVLDDKLKLKVLRSA